MNGLAQDSELLVSELVTNAVKATAGRDEAAVRLQLSADGTRVLIEVWDADPRPPVHKDLGEYGTPDPQEEGGRGLFLVAALSARWDWYLTGGEPMGKVVWCEIEALLPPWHWVRRAGGENMAFAQCAGRGLTASLVHDGDRLFGPVAFVVYVGPRRHTAVRFRGDPRRHGVNGAEADRQH